MVSLKYDSYPLGLHQIHTVVRVRGVVQKLSTEVDTIF